jgi:hypothetical protein
MKRQQTETSLSLSIWFYTWLTFSIGALVLSLFDESAIEALGTFLIASVCSCIGSLPGFVLLLLFLKHVQKSSNATADRFILLLLLQLSICALYGFAPNLFFDDAFSSNNLTFSLSATGCLFTCNCVAVVILRSSITSYFKKGNHYNFLALDQQEDTTYATVLPLSVIEVPADLHDLQPQIIHQN